MATNETVTPHLDRRTDLLDPATLAQLGGIDIIARQVVHGFMLGLHRSPNRGFSAEFAELRAYQPGDDLRTLDWRMYARSDRFFVKQYEEETNLRAYMLIDISESMAWTSRAAPAHQALVRQAPGRRGLPHPSFGRATSSDSWPSTNRIARQIRARGGKVHWRMLLQHLHALEGQRAARTPSRRSSEVAMRLKRKGLVILISDLLVNPEATAKALIYLQHTGHEVLVFHLIDPGRARPAHDR